MAAPCPRFAVALTLLWEVQLETVHREMKLCMLRGAVASLRATGWDGPVVCLTHGAAADELSRSPACSELVRLPALPAYDAGPAGMNSTATARWYAEQGRLPPPASSRLQQRTDGRETSVKLAAWALTKYDLVLHTDVDVLFLESPLAALTAAHAARLVFQAARVERAQRGYDGLNTHMMILRPSLEVHAVLLANAAAGHFVPFTRTEQDVLESALPPSAAMEGAAPAVQMPAHLHYFKHGCSRQFCCGSPASRQAAKAGGVASELRMPRRVCGATPPRRSKPKRRQHSGSNGLGGNASNEMIGRVLGFRRCDSPGCGRGGGGGGRGRGRALKEAPSTGTLPPLVYTVEPLSSAPLAERVARDVTAEELCGGALELLERCHALKWPAVLDSAAGAVSARLASAYQGGERLGCGKEF